MVTENRSVGGSIPPLGTISSNKFRTLDRPPIRLTSRGSIRGIILGNKGGILIGGIG
jgi:hypothetical protein